MARPVGQATPPCLCPLEGSCPVRGQHAGKGPRGGLNILGADVEVCDCADHAAIGSAHAHAVRCEPGDELFRRAPAMARIEEDDVGFDLRVHNADAGKTPDHVRQPPGIGMVLRQSFDVVVEGIKSRRRQDARLAHSPAHAVLPGPGVLDEGARARQNAPNRAAKAFRQIEPDAIAWSRHLLGADAACHCSVEDTGAVHMYAEATCTGGLGHGLKLPQRPDGAASTVDGLLEREQPRARAVTAAGLAHGRQHLGRAKDAALGWQRPGLHTSERGGAAGLGGEDVGKVGADHLIARPAVHEQSDLIAHGARGQEYGRFLAEQVCDPLLQRVGGGIAGDLLITHLGVRHGFAHACRRPGGGVAGELDQTVCGHAYTLPCCSSLGSLSMEAFRADQGKAGLVFVAPAAPRCWPLASACPIWEDSGVPAHLAPLEAAERMYDWLIVILVGLAGYVEAPGWFILLGAFGLMIEGWWGRLGLLRHSPRALSTKKTAYFVAGAIGNLGLAGFGYLVGQLLRALTP